MSLYIEYLSSISFLKILFKEISLLFGNRGTNNHYYIDATLLGKNIANIFGRTFGCQFKKLEFKMIDVKDENGELIRIRIFRKDLFEIQQKIINSDTYRILEHNSWKNDRTEAFLKKGLSDFWIMDEDSASRFLYIINVVSWHKKQRNKSNVKFIVNFRPWLKIYKDYASRFGIQLINGNKKFIPILQLLKKVIINIIKKNMKVFISIDNIRKGKKILTRTDNLNADPLLYLEGRGDINIQNDGNHSDFFWAMNSDFPYQNILYDYNSKTEKKLLSKFGVKLNDRKIIYNSNGNTKLQINKASEFKEEKKEIKLLLSSYQTTKVYWQSLFKTNNVKLFLTWFKYDKYHIAIADAIKDNGGISAVWQMAYDGFTAIECRTFSDLIFSHSHYSSNLEAQLNSQFSYNIIMGYPKDYAAPLLKNKASILRNKLKSHGAKKIIFSIDENSVDDDRWHTGHQLQRENYSYLLEKVLEISWLGAVFKPKNAKTLRRRLGEVNELLLKAEKTGRCIVFEDSGRHTTLTAPLLTALMADMCIHGHLSSGTAAIECALAGLPTLLIDREGCFESKFYDLPKGKVIFKDWPEAINAVMDYFQTQGGIPGFGDWTDHLDEFDPFRDGKAATRMGTYLHWLIQGFEERLDRDTILADAAERYAEEWGNDKIIIG